MTPAGKRRLGPEQRREHLLDVALQLAAGRDLASVSVQEIAARAGVSEGLLYHYFPTKDALLAAAVQRAADAMTTALNVAGHLTPLVALTAALTAYLDHVQADPTGWRALLQARTGPLADVADAIEAQSRGITLSLLGAEHPSPALAAALDGWAALERQVCLNWLAHPEMSRATVEDLLLSSFISALQAAARHDEQARLVVDLLNPGSSSASAR